MSYPLPECAKWVVWSGPEVEGTFAQGAHTTFVRRWDKTMRSFLYNHRVWFCAESLDSYAPEGIVDPDFLDLFHLSTPMPVFEIDVARMLREPVLFSRVLPILRPYGFFALRIVSPVTFDFDEGDLISLGLPYQDAIVTVGTPSQRMTPMQYQNDKRIA